MSSSPAGSATPFSDYTSLRSNRGLTDVDDSRVLEVYVLKNSADPVLVLVPISRVGTYSEFWAVIRNDIYPDAPSGENDNSTQPLIYLLDPMTLLRSELWPDLLPTLRGKRLLVLPGDAAPLPPNRKPSSWTSLTPKSTPTNPETTRITVDAHPSAPTKKWAPPPQPLQPPQPQPQLKPTPTPTPAPPDSRPPGFRVITRTDSFRKTPEFAFDIALWCRFAPKYKPSFLMHVQFREIMLQVVPEQSRGLDIRLLMSKVSSALTNMLRRQGCLGVLTSQPMQNFKELLVKPEALVFALEDWPSCEESLGLTVETLRWIQEPVLLYCEILDVHFPHNGEGKKGRGRGRGAGAGAGAGAVRRVQVECVSEDEVD